MIIQYLIFLLIVYRLYCMYFYWLVFNWLSDITSVSKSVCIRPSVYDHSGSLKVANCTIWKNCPELHELSLFWASLKRNSKKKCTIFLPFFAFLGIQFPQEWVIEMQFFTKMHSRKMPLLKKPRKGCTMHRTMTEEILRK